MPPDFYDLLPNYAFSISASNFVITINRTLLSDIGFTKGEIIGKKLDDLVSGGSRIFLQTHLYPLLKLNGSADEIYLSFVTKNKEEIPVLLNAKLHEISPGTFEAYFGGIQISRRNQYETELLQAKRDAQKALDENVELLNIKEKLKHSQQELELQLRTVSINVADQDELSKVLSHDLQEPLRKISLFSSRLVLHEKSSLNEQTVESLQKIAGFSAKVRKLLDSLQKFNSLDVKQIKKEESNLSEICKKLNQFIKTIPEAAKVNFDTSEFEAVHVSTINTDSRLIMEMLKELINNAVLYKDPEKDLVTVKISFHVISKNTFVQIGEKYDYKDYLVISFFNDGIGNFNSETKAFELFKRSDQLFNESLIGLTYCRRIAQLLNGEISVTSEFGEGTMFTITVPIV